MASQYKTSFQRSQSKVWWGNNYLEKQHSFDYSSLDHEIVSVAQPQSPVNHQTPDKQSTSWLNRQGSPSSHKSQDSGFSDVDTSPNFSRTLSGHSRSSSRVQCSPDKNLNQCSISPDKTPKKSISYHLNEITNQRSPSVCSSGAPTPPTVIRKPQKVMVDMPLIVSNKCLSFSAPNSPTALSDSIISQIDSFNFQNTSPLVTSQPRLVASPQSPPTVTECNRDHKVDSPRASCRCSKDRSIRRSRVITKNSNVNKNLMGLFRQSSEPVQLEDSDETLVRGPNFSSLKIPKSILKTACKDKVETDDNNNASHKSHNSVNGWSTTQQSHQLPTYSDLYPTGTSTPIFGSPVKSPYHQSLPITPKRSVHVMAGRHEYENITFRNMR
jgi:hypothetical protein